MVTDDSLLQWVILNLSNSVLQSIAALYLITVSLFQPSILSFWFLLLSPYFFRFAVFCFPVFNFVLKFFFLGFENFTILFFFKEKNNSLVLCVICLYILYH